MSVETLEAPAPAAPAPSPPGMQSMDSLLSDFMVRENIPQPSVKVEGQGDSTPPAETPAPTPPVAETPAPAPEAPVVNEPPHLASIRERRQSAELKKRIEEQEAKLREYSELEDIRPKYEETTARLTEAERLREEAEKKAAEFESYYKNEVDSIHVNPMEDPRVRQAAQEAGRELYALIPDDLSGVGEGPLPLSPQDKQRFVEKNTPFINETVEYWNKIMAIQDPACTTQQKGTLIHMALTQLAERMGVDPAAIEERDYNGHATRFIDVRHPTFQHLKANIGRLASATENFRRLENEVKSNPFESAKDLITKRSTASLEAQKQMGIGVFGNDLQKLLEKTPDNELLVAMSALEAHPDLVKELSEEQKRQGLFNGHKLRKYTIPVNDAKAYDETGKMLMRIDMERDVAAPLFKPLQKLAARQSRAIAEKDAEIAKLRAEIDRRSVQGEAGSPRAGESVPTQKVAFTKPGLSNADTMAYLEKSGLI